MPIEIGAPSADMRDQQVAFGIVRVNVPEIFQRPDRRLDGAALHFRVPFERPRRLAGAVERELGLAAVQEDDVVVAAGAGVAAPFRPGEADELAFGVQAVDQVDGGVPVLLGDVEVVGGVAEHVEAGDIASVGEIVFGVVDADRVLGVHMQVGEPCARRRESRIDTQHGAGFRHVRQSRNAGRDLDLALAPCGRNIELEHRPACFRETRRSRPPPPLGRRP